MPPSKGHGEEPQTKTDIPVVLLAARAKLHNHLDDRMMTDQLRSLEEPNEPSHSLNNAEAQICKRSWTSERHAAFVMRVARRVLRPSTRLVLAMNSMDVGRREGTRGVIDTAAPYTVAGRAGDRAHRQICAARGIGHLINVMPESELYRFGNGGLLTSTERATVPVVLADHLFCCPAALWKALCFPCSLEEMLLKVSVWTSRVAAKPWNTVVDHNRWKTRWLDIIA